MACVVYRKDRKKYKALTGWVKDIKDAAVFINKEAAIYRAGKLRWIHDGHGEGRASEYYLPEGYEIREV